MSSEVQFNLRIPAELKLKINIAATANNRSINSEAEKRLSESFNPKVRITDYENLSEPAMGVELDGVTIGLVKSHYSDITLQPYRDGKWVLSYHALRCMVDDADAKALIERGCLVK